MFALRPPRLLAILSSAISGDGAGLLQKVSLMLRNSNTTLHSPAASVTAHRQRRYHIAALVYFLYGLFYLGGAQYLTNMNMAARGMGRPWVFLVVGGVLTVLLPWLVYSRFAIAFSLHWRPDAQRSTLFLNFTFLLGLMVVWRVVVLVYIGAYTKTWVHTTALVLAAVNASCLLWASLHQPWWIDRAAQGGASYAQAH